MPRWSKCFSYSPYSHAHLTHSHAHSSHPATRRLFVRKVTSFHVIHTAKIRKQHRLPSALGSASTIISSSGATHPPGSTPSAPAPHAAFTTADLSSHPTGDDTPPPGSASPRHHESLPPLVTAVAAAAAENDGTPSPPATLPAAEDGTATPASSVPIPVPGSGISRLHVPRGPCASSACGGNVHAGHGGIDLLRAMTPPPCNCAACSARYPALLRELYNEGKQHLEANLGGAPLSILVVEWLRLQDPLQNFPPCHGASALPGQLRPGLGIARELDAVLLHITRANSLDGLLNVPEHWHNAWLYSIADVPFYFLNPAIEGYTRRAAADLACDIQNYRLPAVAWAVASGFLREVSADANAGTPHGRYVSWVSEEQVCPASHRLDEYFASTTYRDILDRAYRAVSFKIDWRHAHERSPSPAPHSARSKSPRSPRFGAIGATPPSQWAAGPLAPAPPPAGEKAPLCTN
eukprot:TRINITY_DN3479_c0_g1_i2.p1 TRINITY_DN3479_c0_g1~~TRINITY_DN3479_c0_g1_i2.p1  ORF type:complete len:464 (-),score=73.83 TRINITY_DN3479_c0_g1_i2:43-1434(-)